MDIVQTFGHRCASQCFGHAGIACMRLLQRPNRCNACHDAAIPYLGLEHGRNKRICFEEKSNAK